jgi:hypothetical protein
VELDWPPEAASHELCHGNVNPQRLTVRRLAGAWHRGRYGADGQRSAWGIVSPALVVLSRISGGFDANQGQDSSQSTE